MIPAELKPTLEDAVPSCIVTSSADGIPNIANLTKVWGVDGNHVAIANQLLNKTYRNLAENSLALIKIVNPADLVHWEVAVRYVRSEREGPLYERIRHDIETLSWVGGGMPSAPVKSAILFEVLNAYRCEEESRHLMPAPETYGDLLNALATIHGWERCSYWIPEYDDDDPGTAPKVKLKASRGVPGAGVIPKAFDAMGRLAGLSVKERRTIRLNNVRSQLQYLDSVRNAFEPSGAPSALPLPDEPVSFLAVPIVSRSFLHGIVCCEATRVHSDVLRGIANGYADILSSMLGDALFASPSVEEGERESLFRQAVERAKLEWEKASEPFLSALSARERQVASHVAKGETNAEIAMRLFVSPRTVTTHLERIYEKLNVTSRVALTRYVMERGLLPDFEHKDSKSSE
ncbi:LuxR C-terminal-related transcriptional regulator [Cohnella suwonensis]|uniref:LuxR C-terminal-related transcriptional regulator n=1 Tax=Cohnella suwonensis TaxID=696072 RepID=A0ABW0LSZ1_9BACL